MRGDIREGETLPYFEPPRTVASARDVSGGKASAWVRDNAFGIRQRRGG